MNRLHRLDQLRDLPSGTRLAVYGAGGSGEALLSYLQENSDGISVSLFVDKTKRGRLRDVEIISPDHLQVRGKDYDRLLICSMFADEIGNELKAWGISDYWVADSSIIEALTLVTNPSLRSADGKRDGTISFMPTKDELGAPNALEKFVLQGYLPEEPFITRQMRVTAFGSCFAKHIRHSLVQRGYLVSMDEREPLSFEKRSKYAKSHMFHIPWNFNNTFTVRQQFEWALEGKTFHDNLWFDENKELCLATGEAQEATRALLLDTRVFIFTAGLAEIWENAETGEVFWRTVPAQYADPKKHRFRLSTVEENVANLEKIYDLIRAHIPEARLIMTLSPVPLRATFRNVSCVAANCVSKAVLRVALDELWRRHQKGGFLYYWPSYEILKEVIRDPYREDNRRIRQEVIDSMMNLFSQYYLR